VAGALGALGIQLFCARNEYCMEPLPRQPEREICTGMHVRLAFSTRIRIRDNGREGAGEIRVVEHVSIREDGHLDCLLDRAGLRSARSRPAVPSRGGVRGQRERGRAPCDWPLAVGGGIHALGKDVAALVRAGPRADETREESCGTAQAARRRACTAPRRGPRSRGGRGRRRGTSSMRCRPRPGAGCAASSSRKGGR
jgi:hypothetical protein